MDKIIAMMVGRSLNQRFPDKENKPGEVILQVRNLTSLRQPSIVGYVYFTLVPLLLLVWRTAQGHEVLPESSWWESVWPFFFVGLIFTLIEVMVLIGTRSSGRQGAGGVRDVLFVVIYGILLLSVAP